MNSTSPRWGLLALGLALLAIALGAGGLSLTLNFVYGMRKGGLEYAAAFVLADLGKILIPVAAAILGWNRQFKVAVALCAVASVWCALSMYADRTSRQITAATVSTQQYNGATADLDRMRRELAAITETGEATDLTKLAEQAGGRAEAEQTRRGGSEVRCKDCEKWRNEAAAFTERASKAKRRAQLEEALAAAKSEAASSQPVEADGMAAFIAANFAGQIASNARIIAMGVALVAIMLIESLVYLSIPATRLIAASTRGASKPRVERPAKAERAEAAKPAKLSKAEALAVLRAYCHSRGGDVIASKAEMIKLCVSLFPGRSRNTIGGPNGWLEQWQRDGKLVVIDHAEGTILWRTVEDAA